MTIDWSRRRALERRMRGRVFRSLSRALASAVVQRSVAPVAAAREGHGAGSDDLVFAIQCHGVAGHVIALPDSRLLPASVIDVLQREARRIAERAEHLSRDLRALGGAAAAAGLPFIPLKGSFLRSERYASLALRPSSDIDLLADAEALPAWRDVLRAAGYTVEHDTTRHVIFSRPDDALAPVEGEHPWHPRPVELHTRLSDVVMGRTIDITDRYRAGLHEGRILGDVPALLPGDEALALHLFLHAACPMLDRGMRLAQVLDFGFVSDSDAVRREVHARLGHAAWAVVALLERNAPGLLAPGWLADAGRPPGPIRQRLILARPCLMQGDPYRLATLSGELLVSMSPRAVVGRVTRAWSARIVLDDLTGHSRPARYRAVLRSFFGRRSP